MKARYCGKFRAPPDAKVSYELPSRAVVTEDHVGLGCRKAWDCSRKIPVRAKREASGRLNPPPEGEGIDEAPVSASYRNTLPQRLHFQRTGFRPGRRRGRLDSAARR